MIRHYSVENTVMQGKRAEFAINGRPIKMMIAAWALGPFIFGCAAKTDKAGKAILTADGLSVATRWHFGIGKATVSAL